MFTTANRLTARRPIVNTCASLFRRSYANTDNDVVVIGGGPGGYVAAIKAGQLGLKTTCVEGRGTLGGTCLNVGCIPSKALLHSSHMLEMANHEFEKHGIIAKDVSFDLSKMMKQKTDSVGGLTKGIEGLFKKNKVEYARGWGKITSPNEVTVTGQNGETTKLFAKNIIIATGSEPIPLPFLPFDEKTIVSSTGALSLGKVPEHLVVVGGGVIGLELGSVWRRLGAKVTVVELFDRISPFLDVEVGKYFLTSLKKQGIEFKLSTKLLGGKVLPEGGAVLNVESVTDGVKEEIKADAVLVSIGRRPYTLNLGLKEIGVEVDNKGRVKTDSHFKTNISSIFAIGDAIAGPMLAHKAEEEGIACAEHIAGLAGHVNYDAIPNVIYTHPEVASCGKTEEELKAAGVQYKVGKFMYKANSRARTNADDEGLVKIIADKETDRVLGIHIIGPNAGEQIAEGVLAMEYGASSEDIGRTCHAHPTLSEAFKEAAMAVYDKPIHS